MNSTEKIIVIHGDSTYLRHKTEIEITRQYQTTVRLDSSNLSEDEFAAICTQRDLFVTAPILYILRTASEHRELWKLLPPTNNAVILFNYAKKSLTAEIKKLATTCSARIISRPEPRPYDYPTLVTKMCAELGLKLDVRGRQLLLNTCGRQLDALDNEIQKLVLVFGEKKISAPDIAPHLGVLREDSSFVLIDLLLEKKYAEAQLFVEDLLKGGTHPLPLLGVITYFVRNLLGEGTQRLPPRVQAKYQHYRDGKNFRHLLTRCHEADLALKTSATRANLELYAVVQEIANADTLAT